jgi:hypothetical protein
MKVDRLFCRILQENRFSAISHGNFGWEVIVFVGRGGSFVHKMPTLYDFPWKRYLENIY